MILSLYFFIVVVSYHHSMWSSYVSSIKIEKGHKRQRKNITIGGEKAQKHESPPTKSLVVTFSSHNQHTFFINQNQETWKKSHQIINTIYSCYYICCCLSWPFVYTQDQNYWLTSRLSTDDVFCLYFLFLFILYLLKAHFLGLVNHWIRLENYEKNVPD